MSEASEHRYLIALGSNVRFPGTGSPRAVLAAATRTLQESGLEVLAVAPVHESAPVGPSARRYANGAVLVAGALEPPEMLALLQSVEREFGRNRRGQRWRARTLDLDIILWSGGAWRSRGLTIPHPAFRDRPFVLRPVARIAPHWRDPLSGLSLRQLAMRGA